MKGRDMKLRNAIIYCIFLLGSLSIHSLILATNGITYEARYADRFGDYITTYCDCRWLSHIHNFEFYYKPFRYGDQLIASTVHPHSKDHTKIREIYISDTHAINPADENVLYVTNDHFMSFLKPDWNDPAFVKLIQDEISPIDDSIKGKLEIPVNHFSVALHVRRGGGADRPLYQENVTTSVEGWKVPENWGDDQWVDKIWPTRFPSDIFYIEQLRALALLHPDKLIYAHIFTDDPSPELIAEKYKAALNNPRIVFGYRTENNYHYTNVLEDFFAMMDFDALIRAGSNYSAMAGAIGQVSYEAFPTTTRWEGRKLITTQICTLERAKGKVTANYLDTEN